jgi:hypothetical protein
MRTPRPELLGRGGRGLDARAALNAEFLRRIQLDHKARPPATRYISPYPDIGSSVTRGPVKPRYMDDVPRYPLTKMEVKKTLRLVIVKTKIDCDRAFVVL